MAGETETGCVLDKTKCKTVYFRKDTKEVSQFGRGTYLCFVGE